MAFRIPTSRQGPGRGQAKALLARPERPIQTVSYNARTRPTSGRSSQRCAYRSTPPAPPAPPRRRRCRAHRRLAASPRRRGTQGSPSSTATAAARACAAAGAGRRQRPQYRRGQRPRMHRRSDVVPESAQASMSRCGVAARRVGGLQHPHRAAALRQPDRRRQPVRAGADDNPRRRQSPARRNGRAANRIGAANNGVSRRRWTTYSYQSVGASFTRARKSRSWLHSICAFSRDSSHSSSCQLDTIASGFQTIAGSRRSRIFGSW
jgi:hypothetical protein